MLPLSPTREAIVVCRKVYFRLDILYHFLSWQLLCRVFVSFQITICQCKVFCGDKEGLNASLFCFFQDFSLFGNIARTWYLASLKGNRNSS